MQQVTPEISEGIDDEASDALKLDRQICFLLYAASRKMTAAYRSVLGPLGLTYPQYLVLLVLWEKQNPDSECAVRVSAIGKRLGLDTGTLTPLLKRMERDGIIERSRDVRDERVVRIALTKQGLGLKQKVLEAKEAMRCVAGLTQQQVNELHDELHTVLSKLEAYAG